MMFALIASAIIAGSLVGRIKLGVLMIFLLFWSTLVYDVLVHIIWSSEGFCLKEEVLILLGVELCILALGLLDL